MKSYASGKELADEIEKRAGLFIGEFADVPDGSWDSLVEGVERTPRQMIAYQLGWMGLLLGWERDERAGLPVVTPAEGYRWNRLGGLYESFDSQWGGTAPKQLIDEFDRLLNEVVRFTEGLSETELFEPGQRAWASSTPSAWPVWKWIHINTVAPFTTFRTKIRKWKKVAPAPPVRS